MGEQGGSEAVSGGEEAVLWGDAGEGFKRFLGEGVVALVPGEGVHANQGDSGDGIGARRGGILKGLTADVEATHGGGIVETIEEAAGFSVAVAGDGEVHRFLRSGEIARIECGFVGVQERENAENLVVERAFERGAPDSMVKAARFTAHFLQHAIESFQGEGAGAGAE